MAISMHIITADMEDIMNGEMRLEDGRIDFTSLAETMWKQGRRFWWLLLLLAGIGAAPLEIPIIPGSASGFFKTA